jgi:hypothetical protein
MGVLQKMFLSFSGLVSPAFLTIRLKSFLQCLNSIQKQHSVTNCEAFVTTRELNFNAARIKEGGSRVAFTDADTEAVTRKTNLGI